MISIATPELINLVTILVVSIMGWWAYRNIHKAMDALDAVPGLTKELRSIADEMRDSKIQIAKISVLESALQTAFKRIDEIRDENKSFSITILKLRERSHDHANLITRVMGAIDSLEKRTIKN